MKASASMALAAASGMKRNNVCKLEIAYHGGQKQSENK